MVIFLCQIKERASNSGVVRNEPSIEIDKAKEGMHILNFSESRSGSNSIEFDQVYG